MKYVQSFVDGGGRVRNYFRRRGCPRIVLPDQITSPEFAVSYQAALNAPPRPLSSLLGGVQRAGTGPLIGVYLLLLKGKVVYIGSSLNMPKRVDGHRSNGRPFDKAFFIATTAVEREALEKILIVAIGPSGNRRGNNR